MACAAEPLGRSGAGHCLCSSAAMPPGSRNRIDEIATQAADKHHIWLPEREQVELNSGNLMQPEGSCEISYHRGISGRAD